MAASTKTLDAMITSWERSLRARNRSPRTIRSYLDAARLLLAFLSENRLPTTIGKILPEHLEMFIDDQLKRWRPATAANRCRSLQQLFGWLVSQGEIVVSPITRMRPPLVPEQLVPVVCDEDLRKLLKSCEGPDFENIRDAALLRVMIETGVRLSEATGLKTTDVDLASGELVVLGKGRRRRTVPFGYKTTEALSRYIELRDGHPRRERPELWLSRKGILTASGVAQMLNRRCRESDIVFIHPHQFRHSSAHNWLALGGSEGDALRLFGWRSRDMLSRYGASSADGRAQAAYRWLAPGERL